MLVNLQQHQVLDVVEALRDEQLRKFEKSLNDEKMNKDKNLSYLIEITKNDLNKLNLEPNYDEKHVTRREFKKFK